MRLCFRKLARRGVASVLGEDLGKVGVAVPCQPGGTDAQQTASRGVPFLAEAR
jgi:hypothetical protein